jgi:hypothetical protein
VKSIVIALLLVIAVGVSYVAYSKYQERQMAARFVEAVSDPSAFVVKTWSERAKLECDYGIADVVTRQAPGGTFPVSFTCRATTRTLATFFGRSTACAGKSQRSDKSRRQLCKSLRVCSDDLSRNRRQGDRDHYGDRDCLTMRPDCHWDRRVCLAANSIPPMR